MDLAQRRKHTAAVLAEASLITRKQRESRLYRATYKFGVTNRQQLPAPPGRPGPGRR
jgi:hypothetical protein